ncbi:MAG: endonuclease/exonuclease/phosphatase family protein [Candidatus Cloacimonadales bacterium]
MLKTMKISQTRAQKILLAMILILALALTACSNNGAVKETEQPASEKMPWVKYENLQVGTDTTLEVMSWNIQNFPKHPFAVELAARTILAIDADIVGLQEIQSGEDFTEMLKIMQQNAPEDNWQGYRAQTDAWDLNLAYFYKGSLLQQVKIYEIYPDPEKYHQPFPRKPLVMEFVYEKEDYYVINNHLKAKGGAEDKARRRAAVKLLKKYVDENLADQELFIIGDLNDSITDEAQDNVFAELLADSLNYRFADHDIALDPMQDWSYPYWKYRGQIDHIIITNELFAEFDSAGSEVRVIPIGKMMEGGDNARYKYLTDHRPVVLKLVVGQ